MANLEPHDRDTSMKRLEQTDPEAALAEFRKNTVEVLAAEFVRITDGREVPLVVVDSTGRPDLGDLTRVFRTEGPEGGNRATWTFWVPPNLAEWEAVMEFEWLKPVRCSARIRFSLGNPNQLDALVGGMETGVLGLVFAKPKHVMTVLNAARPSVLVVESQPECGLREALTMYAIRYALAMPVEEDS
jgi:hypothetical protein